MRPAGEQVWSAEYAPFGKQVSTDGELDHVTQFTGKDLDEDTGLYYFNARWYDQETGRFITQDDVPLDPNDPFTLNLYTYCDNEPLNNTDPTGHESEELIPQIPTFRYNGNAFINTVSAIDNAVINVGNDAINCTNQIIKEAKYVASNGIGDYGKAAWESTKSEIQNIGEYAKSIWNYTTQTPIGQQVADTGQALSKPDTWSRIGTTTIEGYALGKIGGAVSDAAVSGARSRATIAETTESGKTYQTYTKTNPETGEVYSGRTSGTGTPRKNVAKRDANHHMNKEGFGPAELDMSSTNKVAIRGREQQLIDYHGGAKSTGGTSGNRINGISPKNPKFQYYMNEAIKEFGKWLGF